MTVVRVLALCFFFFSGTGLAFDEFLDQVDEALTIAPSHGNVRARLSGVIDLELFRTDQPPLGLIDTNRHLLLNPRLSLFLDAQLGSHLYLYVQSRVDRGFDPSDNAIQIRLDEYALRITPWNDGRLNVQIGKFATVVGNWVERHHSWENPFITAPLPYENFTAVSDILVPASAQDFLSRFGPNERYEHNPLIWGPNYTTGVSVACQLGKFDYAAEVKNSALVSRPTSWDAINTGFDHPTVNARLGFQPNESWKMGISASDGPYLRSGAAPKLPIGRSIGDYSELLLGQDVSFAWHHVQLWAEFYEARFEVPHVGDADTFAYYLEAKYKFTPQFFTAVRWNQQLFSTVPDSIRGDARWGHDIWRIDTAVAYRFTAHAQLKLQYSFQDEHPDSEGLNHTFAAQFTVRF